VQRGRLPGSARAASLLPGRRGGPRPSTSGLACRPLKINV
jgi:hypothetical protein